MGGTERRSPLVVLGAAVTLAVVVVGGAPPAAADVDGLEFDATIDERAVTEADANDPLRLTPDEEPIIRIEVTNDSGKDLFIRSVRLDSQVVGLTFFTFTTRVDLELPAGDEGEREFAVDLGDLGSQATGLLPARVALLDSDREVLAAESFPVDVRGSLRSVYGLFGMSVALITAFLLVAALARLAAGRLPANRWGRAARFATPGIGVGLTLTFTLSVLRVVLPSASLWLALIVVGGLVGIAAGYLAPGPSDDGEDDLDDLDDRRLYDDETVVESATVVASPGTTLPGREPPRLA